MQNGVVTGQTYFRCPPRNIMHSSAVIPGGGKLGGIHGQDRGFLNFGRQF